MPKLSANAPPGVPVSEIESYTKLMSTDSLCHNSSCVKGDRSEVSVLALCCNALICTNQNGHYNMKSCGICCGIFGCTIGWNSWAKFCFPIICCFMPVVSCGKECGLGVACCGNGCFLGTQSQVVTCCCGVAQYGNRNIDKV